MCYIGIPTRMVSKVAHVRGGLSALAIVFAVAGVAAQAPQGKGLQVVPVVRGDHLNVTAELRDGLTSDVRAAIDSGLKTIFTYTIDLRLDVPGWIDRTIATAVITNSVEYNNLDQRYTLESRVDGKDLKPEITKDALRVRQWMTRLEALPLFSTRILQPNREYYVRVSATARPSYGSILWPFGSGTSAQTKFVFLR